LGNFPWARRGAELPVSDKLKTNSKLPDVDMMQLLCSYFTVVFAFASVIFLHQ